VFDMMWKGQIVSTVPPPIFLGGGAREKHEYDTKVDSPWAEILTQYFQNRNQER
jgi:hypothetical protein